MIQSIYKCWLVVPKKESCFIISMVQCTCFGVWKSVRLYANESFSGRGYFLNLLQAKMIENSILDVTSFMSKVGNDLYPFIHDAPVGNIHPLSSLVSQMLLVRDNFSYHALVCLYYSILWMKDSLLKNHTLWEKLFTNGMMMLLQTKQDKSLTKLLAILPGPWIPLLFSIILCQYNMLPSLLILLEKKLNII